MITITLNKNFTNWLNITMLGKLIDNAMNSANAMQIASRLQRQHKQATGERLPIISR
jgi:hypothetical protein